MGVAPAIGPETTRGVADIVAVDLRPQIGAIDAGAYPETVLRALGAAGAFAHHTDGTAAGLLRAIEAMGEIAEACLSTAFCTWCQDALVWYLARSDAPGPAGQFAATADGRHLGGTGLSNPMKAFSGIEPLALSGTRVPGGYRVRGRLPWVSNLAPGHRFAAIFALDDGRRVMAALTTGTDTVGLAANTRFVALEGTGTYTVLIRDAFVSDDDVIAPDAAAFVPRIRNGFVLLQTGMGLGLARGVAALMRTDDRGRRQAAALPLPPEAIEERIAVLHERIAVAAERQADPDRSTFLEILRLRLDVSWLALESAQAAMLQFGARGYQEGSEAFRRFREAQFVSIVTPSAKHITAELARSA
ncbi:Acyl-CoA dehydrogenase [Methylobacterium pseudosasicola]|uniref:Acyl-CoA dehydrogenase n=1 Tax=Methylobacterium pseudosasicola TaxID=582667 RepID=A0A1I4MF28_9HYPH|nr:Acyl-CoA dehydrogenase [Methylobacterium pseudosasicola]